MTSASTVWTHGLWVPYCRGREAATPSPSRTVPEMDGHRPGAGEACSEGNTTGVPAGRAPRRVGGSVAPGLWDPIVPDRAGPPRIEGDGVPLGFGLAGGELVHAQCQSVVRADCQPVVESDFSSSDRARPGPERR